MHGLSILIAISATSSVLGEVDMDCFPTYISDKLFPSSGCCGLQVMFPGDFEDVYADCTNDILKPPKSRREQRVSRLPKPAEVSYNMCLSQCLFRGLGMVSEGALVEDAVRRTITAKDKLMYAVVESANAKCLKSYKTDIATSQKCNSGAFEFYNCLTRELYRNCPASLWTSSQDSIQHCEYLKDKLSWCPKIIAQIINNGMENNKFLI